MGQVLHLLRESPFGPEAVQTVAHLLRQAVPLQRVIDFYSFESYKLTLVNPKP